MNEYEFRTARADLYEGCRVGAPAGFLAAEPGYRIRKGKLTDDPVISVIVERKLPPGELPPSDDLGGLLGPQNVDVVEANPLQALFAQPERMGLIPRH